MAAALAVVLAACGSGGNLAYGDANSIIVVAEDSVWAEVADSVSQALEPTIFTVRNEKTFQLTQVSPQNEDWLTLRQFRQLVVIGQRTDPWVARALEAVDEEAPEAPALVDREDVWARGQVVTVMLLPEGENAPMVLAMVPELHELLDARFRMYARERMFASGRNDALRDTLMDQAAFGLLLPKLYRWRQVSDTAYMFINDSPTAEQMVRSILVTWMPGVEPASDGVILDHRQAASEAYYDWGQDTQRDEVSASALPAYGPSAREVRGVWTGQIEGFPQGGPFITRWIPCPEQGRTYLLDAWLYAPAKDKYEYVIQFQTILGSFECGS